MTQFAKNLESLLEPVESAAVDEELADQLDQNDEEALNLLGVVALPLLKRFGIPVILVGVAVFLIIWFSVT